MRITAFCTNSIAVSAFQTGPSFLPRQNSFSSFPCHRRCISFNRVSKHSRLRTCANKHNDITMSSTSSSPKHLKYTGEKLVVTTPLFYANAAPHMGSAYPTIAADALCRFYRLVGANPVLITGTDEHGEKIAASAYSSSATDPQTFVNEIAKQFHDLWTKLDIQYDKFVRTTDVAHQRVVKSVLNKVWEHGDIYRDVYDGLYCRGCEEYKVETELEQPGNICPMHQKECVQRKEENYFFALSKYQKQLEHLLLDDGECRGNGGMKVLPTERKNEVLGWVRSGVRDFSVSRANNPWGIRVPRDETHTVYVWFDALFGYVSGLLLNETDNDDNFCETATKKGWPAHVHIIGKDILRFHAVYWPAMLMSVGLPLPRRIIGHGFITKDGLKMGKSLGNTLDPFDLVSQFGSDAVRFYFLRAVDFGRDGDFSQSRFIDVVNADLANSLGNLLNRSLNLARKNCKEGFHGVLPKEVDDVQDEDIVKAVKNVKNNAFEAYDNMDFTTACEHVLQISYAANMYIDRIAPWSKFKSDSPEDVAEAKKCIAITLEACRLVAVGLAPITPKLSKKIYVALGMEQEFDGITWDKCMEWGGMPDGIVFAKPKPVFPRLEVEAMEKEQVMT